MGWVSWSNSDFFQSCIQQITAVLVCSSPSLHYLFSKPAGCRCCAGLPRALSCCQTQHILSGSTRWGQYLRNRSSFLAKAFIFCLHPYFLFTPTEQLQQKDKQILLLLEEKTKIFRDMVDSSVQEEMPGSRLLFRANTEEAPKGEAIMKTAINEGEPVRCNINYSNQ